MSAEVCAGPLPWGDRVKVRLDEPGTAPCTPVRSRVARSARVRQRVSSAPKTGSARCLGQAHDGKPTLGASRPTWQVVDTFSDAGC